MEISQVGEFGLISRFKSIFSEVNIPSAGALGIGDDCAVIPAGERDFLVTTDMLLEGTHFLRDGISPCDLGWKSLAVNLSDVAAMGGVPVASFLSLGIPEGLTVEYMDEFARGYRDLSSKWSVPVLGGDTTRSSSGFLSINVGVIGSAPAGRCKLRSGARPGDAIYVTGTLGDSAAGLEIILDRNKPSSGYLLSRHARPQPRMEEGRALGAVGEVHSMMDVSDGVASDLRHILDASGVSAEIDLDALPISDELRRWSLAVGCDPVEKALAGGEDYELLFTADADTALPVNATRIGTITSGKTGHISYLTEGKTLCMDISGFDHFKKGKTFIGDCK